MNKSIFAVVALTLLLSACSQRILTLSIDLTGTTWKYTDEDGDDYNVTFAAGGRLKTTHPNDVTPDNDFWRQKGGTVQLQYNNAYAKYKGKFVNEDLIEGKAKNVVKKTWRWRMRRIKKKK